jgi:hypothetical protein
MSYEDDFDNIDASLFEKKGNDFYYMIDLPAEFKKLKLEKEGVLKAVIVPYVSTQSPYRESGKLWFFRDYYAHNGLGPTQKDRYFDCVKTFGDDKCPIGDALASMGVKKKAQRLGLVNMFVLSYAGQEINELMLVDHSFSNFLEVIHKAAQDMYEMEQEPYIKKYMHHTEGAVLSIKLSEDSFEKSKYRYASAVTFKPHKGLDGKIEELIPKALDLDTALNKLSYEDAYKRFISGKPPVTKKAEGETAAAKTETKSTKAESAKADKAVEEAVAAAKDESAFDAGWE